MKTAAKEIAKNKIPDIMSNMESLLSLYLEATSSAKYVVDKIWTNARFFTTLASALLTVTAAALVSIEKWPSKTPKGALVSVVLCFLPIIVIVISRIGTKNLEREYSRFLDWISVVDKLQEKLGLYEEMRFTKYPGDHYLLPARFVKSEYATVEEFVKVSLRRKGTLLYYFRILHGVYIVLALLLIVAISFTGFVY